MYWLHLSQVDVEVGMVGLELELTMKLFEHLLVVGLSLSAVALGGSGLGCALSKRRMGRGLHVLLKLWMKVDRRRPFIILNQQMMWLPIIRLVAARLRNRAGIGVDGTLVPLPLLASLYVARVLAHDGPSALGLLIMLLRSLLAAVVLKLLAMHRVAGVLAPLSCLVAPSNIQESVLRAVGALVVHVVYHLLLVPVGHLIDLALRM